MLVLSVLFALTLFIVWHAYLVLTNQTTIEFYANRFDAADARQHGEVWVNPYTVGWRENFVQVFGPSRCAAAPAPDDGERGWGGRTEGYAWRGGKEWGRMGWQNRAAMR